MSVIRATEPEPRLVPIFIEWVLILMLYPRYWLLQALRLAILCNHLFDSAPEGTHIMNIFCKNQKILTYEWNIDLWCQKTISTDRESLPIRFCNFWFETQKSIGSNRRRLSRSEHINIPVIQFLNSRVIDVPRRNDSNKRPLTTRNRCFAFGIHSGTNTRATRRRRIVRCYCLRKQRNF